MASEAGTLRVAMIGYAFMGAAHSQGWRNAHRFFDLPATPQLSVLCGRNAEAARAAAQKLGWGSWVTDWREAVQRDDVDVVDICTPGDSHREIALAALAAGKHVLCEKPLANTVAEAEEMAAAARSATERGVQSMVGFSYRRTPALALARRMVADGRLGRIHHVRAHYLQDWIVDPEFPLVWRLQKDKAGSGALGDIGAHVVDLAAFLTGARLSGVSGTLERFVERRPLPGAVMSTSSTSGEPVSTGSTSGEVTVDDAAAFFGRTTDGALATFEATRFANGRKNAMRIELNGSGGSLAFDFERLNELHVYDGSVPAADAGFRRILVTEPDHPYTGAWWPPGHGLGYEHTFVNEIADFVRAIAEVEPPSPSFDDGLYVQKVLDAVERSSAAASRWTTIS
jgi:predicted dehydrogenase